MRPPERMSPTFDKRYFEYSKIRDSAQWSDSARAAATGLMLITRQLHEATVSADPHRWAERALVQCDLIRPEIVLDGYEQAYVFVELAQMRRLAAKWS